VAPKLASLSLTTEGFLQNAKRDSNHILHLSTHWSTAGKPLTSASLYPTTVAGVRMALGCILKLIRCGCDSEMPCRSGPILLSTDQFLGAKMLLLLATSLVAYACKPMELT